MSDLKNVTVIPRANIYYDGSVTSRTVILPDGSRKTLGIMQPGEYSFDTASREVMEIMTGEARVLLPGEVEWKTCGEGETFEVEANSSFRISTDGVLDYCCSYE